MGLFNKKELARIAELERENEILKATLSKTKGLSVAQEEKYLQRLKIVLMSWGTLLFLSSLMFTP